MSLFWLVNTAITEEMVHSVVNVTMKCTVLLLVVLVAEARSILVATGQGRINGSYLTSSSGRQSAAFRGIPYGQPPIGHLRFKDPLPAASWDGVLDATKEGPTCISRNPFDLVVSGTEDCLKLNVYTPNVIPERLKPVMVWIHGGSFATGSGNGETDIYGPAYFLDRDIVLVTINYRLGPLGFLTTEDVEAPGNYGLLDQSLALKWVGQHIHSFGGDPHSITIFGQSAGGASVELQLLSPLSSGSFHRAISLSGSSMCFWALNDDAARSTEIYAELFDCPRRTSREIVDCLRTINASDLIEKQFSSSKDPYKMLPFNPRVDAEREFPFVPAKPRTLIESKQFSHVPYITGINQNEGAFQVAAILSQFMESFQNDPVHYFRYLLGMEYAANGLEMAQDILQLLDNRKPIKEQLVALEQIFSDLSFFKPVDLSANLFAKFNEKPTYYYHYAHHSNISLGQWMTPDFDLGVLHGDELFLMFSNPFFPPPSSDDDVKASKLLIDLWTSFAINGTPESDLAPKWLPTSSDERHILNIDTKNAAMISNLPFHHRLPFWNWFLNEISVDPITEEHF